jgi:CheY-like chemotaxis protein
MGKKLLVADDSLTIQKVIKLALASDPYEIMTVSNGKDALEQIAIFRPDLVLVDVSLPTLSAFELKEAYNKNSDPAHLKFILMHSAFEPLDERLYRELGFADKLSKPFDPSILRKTLETALTHSVSSPTHSTAQSAQPTTSERSSSFIKPLPDRENSTSFKLEDPLWSIPSPTSINPLAPEPHTQSEIKNLTREMVELAGLTDLNDFGNKTNPPTTHKVTEETTGFDWNIEEPSFQKSSFQQSKPQFQPSAESTSLALPDLQAMKPMIEEQIRRVLPDIVEKIVKEEIRKLLEQPPI